MYEEIQKIFLHYVNRAPPIYVGVCGAPPVRLSATVSAGRISAPTESHPGVRR